MEMLEMLIMSSYGREEDRYGRDYEDCDCCNRDGSKDDNCQGRGQRIDQYTYGSRSRSADPGRDHSYEDDASDPYEYVLLKLSLLSVAMVWVVPVLVLVLALHGLHQTQGPGGSGVRT